MPRSKDVPMLKKLLIVTSVITAGCAAPPPAEEPPQAVDTKNANYGAYPTDYEALVKNWGSANLKDPDSARYSKISKPRKEYMFENKQPFFGYSICAAINAKNSYGGYTGNQTYWFLIRDGKIARTQNTEIPIAGFIPGTTISRGHFVNCNDGDQKSN
jgi:hypothetical protein